MAGLDVDLEKAFTNGDPEAVLDFLAIRTRHQQRSEDEVSVSSVPIFSSDNDMAAFVRDLTIDDAISDCFADVPSECGDTVTSSAPMLMSSRPEKKLTDSGTAAGSTSARKQSSDSKRRLGSARQSTPSKHHPGSTSRNPRGKPRGFLSSLLGRGHKGRSAENQSKPAYQQNDMSSKHLNKHSQPPASVFSFGSGSTQPPLVYDPGVGATLPFDVSARVSKSEVLPDDFIHVHPNHLISRKQHDHMKHNNVEVLQVVEGTVGQVTIHNTDPVSVMKFGSPHKRAGILDTVDPKPESTTQHINPAVTKPGIHSRHTVVEPHFPHSYIQSSSSAKGHGKSINPFQTGNEGKKRQVNLSHNHSVSSVSSKLTEKPSGASYHNVTHIGNSLDEIHMDTFDIHSLQTHTHTVKGPDSEKNQASHPDLKRVHASQLLGNITNPKHKLENKEHTKHKPLGKEDQKLKPQKPWEALCDGIDAFIDFERDPNLEVPLDPHLSAQFDFERRSSEKYSQDDEDQYKVFTNKHQIVERSDSPDMIQQLATSMTSVEQASSTCDEELVTQASCHATVAQCASISKSQTSYSQVSTPVTPKVSSSTQTEGDKLVPSGRVGNPRVGHCLRTAITQLSALAACSACDDVISRTLTDLKKALTEIEGESASPKDVDFSHDITHPMHPNPRSTFHEPSTSGHSAAGVNKQEQADKAPSNAAVVGNVPVVPSPRGAALKTSGFVENGTYDGSKLPPRGNPQMLVNHRSSSKSSTADKPTEKLTKRSKLHFTEKLVTSSNASVDESDSDSTSTVTSEPTTVLVCKKANGSSPKSSNTGRLLEKVGLDKHTLGVDTDDNNIWKSEKVLDSLSSSVQEGDLMPTSNHSATKTEHTAAQSSATVKPAPMSRTTSRSHKNIHGSSRYAGEADRDFESFVTSSWSEMTSVSSVSDVVTSADESSYYSGDDDNDDEDEEEEGGVTMVRLGLLDEDRDDNELRQHRLQRHLAAVLRQSTVPSSTVETVVAATGERLNSQERHVQHVNQGTMYPFSTPAYFSGVPQSSPEARTPVSHPALGSERRGRGEWVRPAPSLQSAPPTAAVSSSREETPR